MERLAKGDFTREELYQLEYTPIVLEEIKILAKNLLEIQERLKEVRRMIEGQVPDNDVLLSIPGVGRLAARLLVILGVFLNQSPLWFRSSSREEWKSCDK